MRGGVGMGAGVGIDDILANPDEGRRVEGGQHLRTLGSALR
jgi:hypothetical protein